MFIKRGLKLGQVTIFIIIAIIIVAGIAGYFLLKNRISIGALPAKFQPIEEYFVSCIKEQSELGVMILGQQAGYIEIPKFSAGSEYRPFSNQLDFLGTPVPYWYYLSGNNIIKEQVPTKTKMQEQLNKFIKENLDCDFSQFRLQGYEISVNLKDVKTTINDNLVSVSVSAELDIKLESEQGKQSSHKLEVQSNLGKMFQEALKIYNYEKQKAFLEDYAVDVLRLYAPVDGVEISCAPKIWLKENVDTDLKQALEEVPELPLYDDVIPLVTKGIKMINEHSS